MDLIQRIKRTLKAYGPKSNVHGLYHYFRSHNKIQKIFWQIILVVALVLMLIHTGFSIKRYMNKGIFVHVSDESKDARFPDITVCNLRPAVESILANPTLYLRFENYLEKRWKRFNPWLQALSKRNVSITDMSRQDLRGIWRKITEIFWASEDTLEFSMVKELAILDCQYEDTSCSPTQFKLVRDPDSWSCHSFTANPSVPIGSQGLQLVLFTEAAFIHNISNEAPISVYGLEVKDLIKGDDKHGKFDYYKKYAWLLDFSGSNRYTSDGVRVIIHEHRTHPMLSPHQLEFETGAAAIVNINEMIVEKQNRYGVMECQSEPYKTIEFVTGYETRDSNRKRSSYYKLLDEKLTEETQGMVYSSCKCYSHRYPLSNSVEDLCYFVPIKYRAKPSEEHLARIRCHDDALNMANKKHKNWVEKFGKFLACNTALLTFTTNTFAWPRNEDVPQIVNKHVLNRFLNISQFSQTQRRDKSIFGPPSFPTREESIMEMLFDEKCMTIGPDGVKHLATNRRWCLKNNQRLRQNVVKLQIKKWQPKSKLAKENPSFEWPEALSEIGGICGLWLGFSAITIVELVEVVWRIISPAPPDDEEIDDSLAQDPSVLFSSPRSSDLDLEEKI